MAVEDLIKLRKRAIKAGMDRAEAVRAKRPALEDFLSGAKKGGGVKKKKATVAKKKPVAKKKAPGKKATGRTSAPAKSRNSGKAKRQTSASDKRNKDVGRASIGKVDYNIESDAWNPRKGSPVERIWRALKKHRDNTKKAFEELKPEIKTLVHTHKNDGTKREKSEMEDTLKYRINRTRFEFAVRTGQHQRGSNRVEYGKGQYAEASKKAKRAAARKQTGRKPARKAAAKKSTGRKKTGKK